MYVNRITPLVVALAVAASACGDDAPGASDGPAPIAAGATPTVTLTSPAPGSRIAGAVDVEMAASGVAIVPAGEVTPGTGHFHVIADTGCLPGGETIGSDADHVHFGSGASTGTIYLDPGSHTLCLQVGDGVHTALDITHSIQVEVGIADVGELCDVFAEADALLTDLEGSTGDFASWQRGAENVRRLMAQLTEGLALIDEADRADVAVVVDAGRTMMEIIVAAESEEAAAAQLWGEHSVLPQSEALDPGEAWLLATCGVSIES